MRVCGGGGWMINHGGRGVSMRIKKRKVKKKNSDPRQCDGHTRGGEIVIMIHRTTLRRTATTRFPR